MRHHLTRPANVLVVALALLAALLGTSAGPALGARAVTAKRATTVSTIPPAPCDPITGICTLTAIVRFDVCDADGRPVPYVLNDGASHRPRGIGIGDPAFTAAGDLRLVADKGRPVQSIAITPDETASRVGLVAGLSGGGGTSVIRFTRVTGSGPTAIAGNDPWMCRAGLNFWVIILQEAVASDVPPSPEPTPTA